VPTRCIAARILQKKYTQVPLADCKEQFKASKYYTSAEWRAKYADGTVTKWLQQVTDFFVQAGNIANPVPARSTSTPSCTGRGQG
jgi:NitT/TauT family transport system substrate-binding protein